MKKKTALATPNGQFHGFCRTASHTDSAPVMNPAISRGSRFIYVAGVDCTSAFLTSRTTNVTSTSTATISTPQNNRGDINVTGDVGSAAASGPGVTSVAGAP